MRCKMEAYLNKGIKEIIDQFPEVEEILNEYDIGCAPCSVGTCLLKDIVEIHNLSADKEQELMAKIAQALYPGKEVKIPRIERKTGTEPKGLNYSLPMQMLVDEHVLIKRLIALIPEVVTNLDVDSNEGRQLIIEAVDFIQSYADKYHHGKEEDILFKYFDEDLDVLKVMHADHKQGRSHVKAILEALDRKDKATIGKHLTAYGALLTEHIKKEDEILLPWMDRNLSISQIGKLFSEFKEADETIGYSPLKYKEFIDRLEKKFTG
jgi:hemerythrin-like domain-containing protein